ncbi:U2 small nuclear ribonucleoprotein A' [Quaeritorhiza haematococci]|nr:U2 small nuclear ribonucleoprotein A' [Quaeritorhiza haematococci]
MPRLKNIMLANNRISRIDPEVSKNIPNITTLILSNNQISELGDLDPLANFKNLEVLSLLDNPVTTKKYYRLYVIFRCKKLRIFDFRKVKEKERQEALVLFSGKEGTRLASHLSAQKSLSTKTFEPGEGVPLPDKPEVRPYQGPTPEEAAKIKKAIQSATSLDEIARLERQLKGGVVPSGSGSGTSAEGDKKAQGGGDGGGQEVEMDED